MKNITLKRGQSISINFEGRSIVVSADHPYPASNEAELSFYCTDDRNNEKHTSHTGVIAYAGNDLLWNNPAVEKLKFADSHIEAKEGQLRELREQVERWSALALGRLETIQGQANEIRNLKQIAAYRLQEIEALNRQLS